MKLLRLRAGRRLLRKPTVIIVEVAAITLTSVLGTIIPQSGATGGVEGGTLRDPSVLLPIVDVLGLDRIFSSIWFVALVVLAGCSLSLVLQDQSRRAWRLWRRTAAGATLSGAPFLYETDVPLAESMSERRIRYRDSLRIGVWGSPVFHLGLLLLLVAGLVRLLFGTDAVVDLVEGETLPPLPSAYGAQWPGLLAEPFRLTDSLSLHSIDVELYAGGGLRRMTAEVDVGGEQRFIAINERLTSGAGALYLTSTYGPAVFLVTDLGGEREGHVLLLNISPDGRYRHELALPGGAQIVITARDRHDAAGVEVRVLDNNALLALERLGPGEGIRLVDGRVVEVTALAKWARFTAQRDASVPIAYVGFTLIIAGALLMYGVIRVESLVVWEPRAGGVHLTVAMRPQRFVPLFAERFERLVADSRRELETPNNVGHA